MNGHEDTISENPAINSRHAGGTSSGRVAGHEASLPSPPNLPPRAMLREPRSINLRQGQFRGDTITARVRAKTARRRFHRWAGHLDEGGRDPAPSQRSEDMEAIAKNEALTNTEAKSFFNGIALKTPCVFLCLGPPENCRVVQVHVAEDDEDEKVFEAIKESWSKNGKRMPFRKVAKVQEVTLRLMGQHEDGGTDTHTFVGIYEQLGTAELGKGLRAELDALDEAASHWQGPDKLAMCRQDYASGEWDHAAERPSHWYSYRDCDIQDSERVHHKLRSLSLLPALTLAFDRPSLAKGQRLLDGLAQGPGLYSTRDMLRNLYRHNPRVCDVSFNGYSITEEWDQAKYLAAVILVVITSIGSAAIFRPIFGDWQTAIAASALGVATMALVIQWTQGWSIL